MVEDLYESIFLKAAIPGLGNMYVAGIYEPPINPLADFIQSNINTLEYTNILPDFVLR